MQETLGHNLIEWAIVDESPILLQVQNSVVHELEEAMVIPAALGHPFALDFVKLAHRYSTPLGDELVLGWRAGAPFDLEPIPFAGRSLAPT